MTGQRDDETTFLNVDLDIWADYDLAPMVEAFGSRVSDMFTGTADVPVEEGAFQTHLELAIEERELWNPDAAIQAFVRLIDDLAQPAKRLWDDANLRNFDIGIQGGVTPRAFQFSLHPDTLAAASRLKANVALTIYSVDVAHLQRDQRRRATRDEPAPSHILSSPGSRRITRCSGPGCARPRNAITFGRLPGRQSQFGVGAQSDRAHLDPIGRPRPFSAGLIHAAFASQ